MRLHVLKYPSREQVFVTGVCSGSQIFRACQYIVRECYHSEYLVYDVPDYVSSTQMTQQ